MKTVRFAVIGSRETDAGVMSAMGQAAAAATRAALKAGFKVEWDSGGCWKGPDQIQFLLADIFKDNPDVGFTVYLPDERKLWLAKKHPNMRFVVPSITDAVRETVRGLHAAPDNLKEAHFNLHGRNLFIIAGEVLESPVDAVFFSAPESLGGKVSGGTAMGVSYARERLIPCFNAITDSGTTDFIKFVRTLLANPLI